MTKREQHGTDTNTGSHWPEHFQCKRSRSNESSGQSISEPPLWQQDKPGSTSLSCCTWARPILLASPRYFSSQCSACVCAECFCRERCRLHGGGLASEFFIGNCTDFWAINRRIKGEYSIVRATVPIGSRAAAPERRLETGGGGASGCIQGASSASGCPTSGSSAQGRQFAGHENCPRGCVALCCRPHLQRVAGRCSASCRSRSGCPRGSAGCGRAAFAASCGSRAGVGEEFVSGLGCGRQRSVRSFLNFDGDAVRQSAG